MATKAAKQSEELTVHEKQPANLMAAMPEYLREAPTEPIKGAENVERTDIIMPRLALASKQTPQVDENHEKYIEGLKPGMFFNTITREVFGAELYVVPLLELKNRAKMPPYGEENSRPLCISLDGKGGEGDPGLLSADLPPLMTDGRYNCKLCPNAQFVDGKRPLCTEMLNFALLVMPDATVPKDLVWKLQPRMDTMSAIGFKSTSFVKGQEWITMLRLRNRDWFTTVFKLTSAAQSDGKNSWHIPVPENAGWLSQDAAAASKFVYEGVKEMYLTGRLRVDEQERETVEDIP